MRWFHLLLGLLAVVTLAAFADPLEISLPRKPVAAARSPLGDLRANPTENSISPASAQSVSPGPIAKLPAPIVADSIRDESKGQIELRLPRRLSNDNLETSEQSAEQMSRELARQWHVNIVYAGNPAVRLSARPEPGDSTEQALQRIFDSARYRITHAGETYEIHDLATTPLRLSTWPEVTMHSR